VAPGGRKRKAADASAPPVADYRYDASRKNNPPAGLAAQGRVRETPKLSYAYDPHLPPVLRFDPTGASDALPELLEEATRRPLTPDEARLVSSALRQRQPWLEWAGKQESKRFVVDPVALHIHERVSAHAIIKMAKREDVQRDLFADPQQSYREAVQFYQHDVDWANRLILGDSLQVMASLTRREDLAGKVQMIYLDPPYGIKFASNFQSEVGKREVKERESDLTREPEMIKAYRDTWTLGVHSYLGYLRDRLILCRDLLTDSGSIFVQISDENLHRVRMVMDEVFGAGNAVATITVVKTSAQEDLLLPSVCDYLLWYARDVERIKYRPVWLTKSTSDAGVAEYNRVELMDGSRRRMTPDEEKDWKFLPEGGRAYRQDNMVSQRPPGSFPVDFEGSTVRPITGYWKSGEIGIRKLIGARRIETRGKMLSYVRFFDDFIVRPLSNFWPDVRFSSRAEDKTYVVQTSARVIARCVHMTTDPGDLVLDPTCGSGTTAYVAEQWGRRWITIDSSRVALAIARQRLLTSRFDQLRTKPPKIENGRAHAEGDPANGFFYRSVSHITLKSIAQNAGLDPIFARHQPVLHDKLTALNTALANVKPDLRRRLTAKLAEKEQREGKRAVTDADRRRWVLPDSAWKEWDVPFDTDDDWPAALRAALVDYRTAWRAKMDEVDAAIAANAEPEELVDQPEVIPDVVRVTGPFSVEAVMPAEESMDDSPVDVIDDDLETFGPSSPAADSINSEAFVDRMRRLLVADGVRFPDNKVAKISRLDALEDAYLHAEGDWTAGNGKQRRVAVSFGPPHGSISAVQVEEALHAASRRGFDDVIFAGFSFDGAAQAVIQDDPNPRVRAHLAHIRPDVQMTGLLKETPNSQLFTVFGTPRTRLERHDDGTFTVTMEGVDIYNPVENTIIPTRADKVAAWFLDTDYDGRTFLITQAFFPDKGAWEKLARALEGYLDEDRLAALSGTTSLAFPPGTHKRCAVKVIDPRGNEVMRVHRLEEPSRIAGKSR
jgi:adenine-specific DNA-methyltransferase